MFTHSRVHTQLYTAWEHAVSGVPYSGKAPAERLTATLCLTWLLVGSAYKTDVNALISKPTQWTELPGCQHWSTLTSFHGHTLLVHDKGVHELREGKWVRIGNMSVPKALPIMCVAGDQMVVVGGCDKFLPTDVSGLDFNTSTNTVRVATIG